MPRLLLPLAGPEEFDDDDVERLPDDLQYLPPDKEREPESTIRKMLVEALLQVFQFFMLHNWYLQYHKCIINLSSVCYMSRDMRFPTMWYV